MGALAKALALTSLVALVFSAAPVQAQTGPSKEVKDWFTLRDRNKDGKLDREEFYQAAVESFYFRDKARKGYLTPDELPEASREAFKAATHADGKLTLDEYVNALFKDFTAADTDADGTLTIEEVDAYMKSGRK